MVDTYDKTALEIQTAFSLIVSVWIRLALAQGSSGYRRWREGFSPGVTRFMFPLDGIFRSEKGRDFRTPVDIGANGAYTLTNKNRRQ